MKNKKLITLAAVALAGIWALWLSPAGPAEVDVAKQLPAKGVAPERLSLLERKLADLQAQNQTLRRSVSQSEQRLEALASRSDAAPKGAAASTAHPQVEGPEIQGLTQKQEARLFSDYFSALDRVRSAERADEAFVEEVRERLQGLIAQDERLAAAEVTRVDCSAQLCRIEAQHADSLSRRLYVNVMLQELGDLMPEASVHIPPNERNTVAYLARNGVSLPTPHQVVERPAGEVN